MINKIILHLGNQNAHYNGVYTLPDECPHCFKSIQPVELGAHEFQNNDGEWFLSVMSLCKACYRPFISLHDITKDLGNKYNSEMVFCGPKGYHSKKFDDVLEQISPSFVRAYNQALEAESAGLSEITGLGFRRAVEFLVKDYLVSENPDDKDKILGMDLSKVINQYVKDEKIRSNVLQAYWLGHDYTHYIKVYEEADLTDLKAYIAGAVYWIGMELVSKRRLERPQPSKAAVSKESNPTQTDS